MTTQPTPSPDAARLDRTYDAPAELIWQLLATATGLEEWFAPDGFEPGSASSSSSPAGSSGTL